MSSWAELMTYFWLNCTKFSQVFPATGQWLGTALRQMIIQRVGPHRNTDNLLQDIRTDWQQVILTCKCYPMGPSEQPCPPWTNLMEHRSLLFSHYSTARSNLKTPTPPGSPQNAKQHRLKGSCPGHPPACPWQCLTWVLMTSLDVPLTTNLPTISECFWRPWNVRVIAAQKMLWMDGQMMWFLLGPKQIWGWYTLPAL